MRTHLRLSPRAIRAGRKLAQAAGMRTLSEVVARLRLTARSSRRKTFSQKWRGKVRLIKPQAGDARAKVLLQKHA